MNRITVEGNDVIDHGYVEITYSKDAPISPLHLDFTRDDGYACSMSLTHHAVRQLIKLIINSDFRDNY